MSEEKQGVAASPPGHQPSASAAPLRSASSQSGVPNVGDCVHLPDYAGEICGGCGEEIDQYGNTPSDFNSCSFPDCGCDGARLCMAGRASERASEYNVEGMYHLRDPRPRMRFMGAFYSGEFDPPASGIEARSDETAKQAQPEGREPGPQSGDAQTPQPKDSPHDQL